MKKTLKVLIFTLVLAILFFALRGCKQEIDEHGWHQTSEKYLGEYVIIENHNHLTCL